MNESKEQLIPQYNKSEWRKGEWDNEPDRQDFIHSGFSCFVLRNRLGNWCGYVGIPLSHALYEKRYQDIDVDVHGGLTYGDKCSPPICHIPEKGMAEDVWWLGFDTGHYGDLSPCASLSYLEGVYKNLQYVVNETKQLAEQLERMK